MDPKTSSGAHPVTGTDVDTHNGRDEKTGSHAQESGGATSKNLAASGHSAGATFKADSRAKAESEVDVYRISSASRHRGLSSSSRPRSQGYDCYLTATGDRLLPIITSDGRRILTKEMAHDKTGFAFTTFEKWKILTIVFIVQISMNWNAAIFGNAVSGIRSAFDISDTQAKLGGALFLIFYAFGCELWAPFSEEFGRKWILQGSLLLVNLWQIPSALATNNITTAVARTFGGLSSAGGSVTLGMVADMWGPEEQQFALAYVVLSSVAGSAVAPVFGGFIETYLSFRWIFWISLIFGAVTQALHLCLVPETRLSVLLDREARRRRESKEDEEIWGPGEIQGTIWTRLRTRTSATCKEIGALMWRPYEMLFTEYIVGFLSLLSGFSDMLVFVGLSSYGMVLKKFGFSTVQVGLAFIALLISYLVAYSIYMPIYQRQRAAMRENPHNFRPERRLGALNILVLGMPLGLVGFAFASLGPAYGVHWIVPLIFLVLIGIANYAIYGATIDYMVAAYGEYSASATGGNGFSRDFLAGTAMLWAAPFYTFASDHGEWAFVWPTLILAALGFALCVPVWIFSAKGEQIRRKSPMAGQVIEKEEHQSVSVTQAQRNGKA